MNVEQKNRLIFLLIVLYLLLGVTDLIRNTFTMKMVGDPLTGYLLLLLYGLMGAFLCMKKKTGRLLALVLLFVTLFSSRLVLSDTGILMSYLIQLLIAVFVAYLLYKIGFKQLFTTKQGRKQIDSSDLIQWNSIPGNLFTHIKMIVPENAYFITDSECIDRLSDYKHLVNRILQLTEVVDVGVDVVTEEHPSICLHKEGVNHAIFLRQDSDYIGSDVLVAGLNEFLSKINKRGKIYWFWSADWEAEEGFLYSEERDQLAQLMANPNNDSFDYGTLSDGCIYKPAETPPSGERETLPYNRLLWRELFVLFIGVTLAQIGWSDLVLKTGILSMGYLSGLCSGLIASVGLYLIIRLLRNSRWVLS